jgi:hypothetical protein
MLQLQPLLRSEKIDFSLALTASESLITRARNFIVSQFLGRPDLTHLLFIDSDIGFDPNAVTRYVSANKDVVAGIYPIKGLDVEKVRGLAKDMPLASVLRYATKLCEGEVADADGFIRAEYAATGFMLIRRNVLEQMVTAYPELHYRYSFTGDKTATAADLANLYALFDTSLDPESKQYLPEDYTFCRRWRALGGEVWVDAHSKFTHVGTFPFQGDFSQFLQRVEKS